MLLVAIGNHCFFGPVFRYKIPHGFWPKHGAAKKAIPLRHSPKQLVGGSQRRDVKGWRIKAQEVIFIMMVQGELGSSHLVSG